MYIIQVTGLSCLIKSLLIQCASDQSLSIFGLPIVIMLVNTIVGRLLALLVTSLARAQSITVNVAENILNPSR